MRNRIKVWSAVLCGFLGLLSIAAYCAYCINAYDAGDNFEGKNSPGADPVVIKPEEQIKFIAPALTGCSTEYLVDWEICDTTIVKYADTTEEYEFTDLFAITGSYIANAIKFDDVDEDGAYHSETDTQLDYGELQLYVTYMDLDGDFNHNG